MMQPALRCDLSYCRIDGHLVFLDIQNDRYFHLAEHLESALVTYLGGGDAPCSSIRRLIDQKILTEGAVDSRLTASSSNETPTRSAMEDTALTGRPSVSALLDTFASVLSIQRKLKTRSLKQTLEDLASLRERRASRSALSHPGNDDCLEAAAAFRRARLYVPIDTCCLLDSIAMIMFLAKRELRADLVFGVARDPFSAHCWVQHGNTVLNDALGHALAFTPIRVI